MWSMMQFCNHLSLNEIQENTHEIMYSKSTRPFPIECKGVGPGKVKPKPIDKHYLVWHGHSFHLEEGSDDNITNDWWRNSCYIVLNK